MKRSRLFLIAAIAVAAIGFSIIAASGINKNLVYYWTPSDLYKAGDKAYGATIRLGGQVAPGSVRRGAGSAMDFDVTDKHQVVHVKSTGIPPQMFREGIGVVVEGTMTRAGVFESERLMVSHNNEYRSPKDGQKIDAKKLIESTKGVDAK
ncbi:MAG TPA: cytochrome c maturation protein CcmE [Thermoanaerobaculia bacterium]|jgi:cytochrome c-type biogenesis protein CcmE|nr:cytochrome c maturation protein CcmE [Thermoanaerobaculia bacterium]